MTRLMRPRGVAVIGASDRRARSATRSCATSSTAASPARSTRSTRRPTTILGRKAYPTSRTCPARSTSRCSRSRRSSCPSTLREVGDKGIAAAVLIPSGFAETGDVELQQEIVKAGREHGVRFSARTSTASTTRRRRCARRSARPYDVQGRVALTSQSGGIGMAILGFSRTTKMGVSAIVGLGNKADIDEDDLLTFFEHDDATQCVAMHLEDLKDGRAFVEAAKRVARKKPVVVLKAGATAAGAKAAASHTGGARRRRQGLRRHPPPGGRRPGARALGDAGVRPLPADPAHAQGRERRDHHRRGRLRRAAVGRVLDNGLELMEIPPTSTRPS